VIVKAEGVTVTFGGRTVLDEVDVALDAGETGALVGRSGSGKTTLLLVLAGLLPPTSGTVHREVGPEDVAYVPQAASLLPELTALQNASLGLRVRGVAPAEAERIAAELLHAVGLDAAVDALPEELSRGMQQRVALARALATRPRLLLADEPTGTLDRETGRVVVDVLRETCVALGTSLLVATHDSEVAAAFDHRWELGAA
jgi:ABC-type lipoprotein export system ATPase subunit